MDRYTILKWKEFWSNLASDHFGRLAGLYGVCNATPFMRLMTVGVIFILVFLFFVTTSFLRSKPPVPISKQLVLMATDERGDKWAMDYLKNQDIGAILNGPVKPGQPLKLMAKFVQKSPNLLFVPEITGMAGERYYPGILKNGQWQPAPKFTLSTASGKLLHKGQFEYG